MKSPTPPARHTYTQQAYNDPEEASTHKSTKTHAGNVLVTRESRPLIFWSQSKWVSRTHRGTFLCQLGGPSCINFWAIMRINRQTDKRRWQPYPRGCRRREHFVCTGCHRIATLLHAYLTTMTTYIFQYEVYRVRTSQYYSAAERWVRVAYSQSALPTGRRVDDVTVALNGWPYCGSVVRFVEFE